jgi:hypothetical protein
LIALHDVTPVHRARLEAAERLFAELDISRVTYLLVPDYHRCGRADESSDFVAWCRAPRPFDVQWFLHGYFHEDRLDAGGTHRLTIVERLSAMLMTGGEAECVRLGAEALRGRLRAGARVFESCIGASPKGFVPPAWLFNRHLLPLLSDQGFEFSESQLRVFQIPSGRELLAPVLTWATRTRLRRCASLAAAVAGRRLWRRRPVVRVALHLFES